MTPSFSVRECLRGYSADALKQMCERWNLAVSSPDNCMRALEKVLQDRLHLQRAVGELAPAELRVLNLVSEHEPASASDVLGVPGLAGQAQMSAVLHNLALWGLVLVRPQDRTVPFSFAQLSRAALNGSTIWLSLPDLAHGMVPAAPPLDFALPPTVQVAASGAASADGAISAFLETIRVVELLNPRVTAVGEIHKSDIARARELAQEAGVTSEALGLSLLMGRQTGALESKGGRLVVTPRAGAWAESPPAQRICELFNAYLTSEELFDVQLFFPQLMDALLEHMPMGSLRRTYHKRLLTGMLAEIPNDTWVSIDAFVETLRRADPNVLFLEENWRAIAAGSRDPSPIWRDRSWQAHEKRLFAWIIQSLLGRLGMVEVEPDSASFRLTSAGMFALGTGPDPGEVESAHEDALVVQPDFEIIAYLDRCTPDLRRKLDTFCDRVRPGHVTTYKLTQESVYRGLRTGVTMDEFIGMLDAHGRRTLPANVLDQFQTWERKLASVTIHTDCRILEFRTADEADAFAAQDLSARRIGECYVLVESQPTEVSAVIDYRQPEPRTLRQEPGLTLRAPWDKTSLFIRRRLQDFADTVTDENGDLIVTLSQARLPKEVDWGLHVAALEVLVDGPLASRYRTALRTWCGDTPSPSIHHVSVVRFSDAETCDSALESPELAPLVEGRLGLYTLVMKPKALNEVKRALKAMGLTVARVEGPLDDGAPETWAVQWVQAGQSESDDPERKSRPVASKPIPDEESAAPLPSYSPRVMGDIIRDAIRRRRPLLIQYQSLWSSSPTVRRVNPVSLDTMGPVPTLSGYCHRIGGARVFKLAQISGIRTLEDEKF
ncbi:MAG: hypothetical protein AMXMBFR4_26950 [Candidatus Hydrogenedentota bacterium]